MSVSLTIICACNDPDSLRANLLASPIIGRCQLIVQHGYTNLPRAYNDAARMATGDILLYVHQDVYLPAGFEAMLRESLEQLRGTKWGVLGPAGQSANGIHGWIQDRGHPWGQDQGLPSEVDTLDELLLIVPGAYTYCLRFDPEMPNHHLIGTDLCMQARKYGMTNHAIRAYCHHNSKTRPPLDPRFWDAAEYVMKKWPTHLPIHSTCADLNGLDQPRIARS